MEEKTNREIAELRQKLTTVSDPAERVELINVLSDRLFFVEPVEAEKLIRQAITESRAAGLDKQLGWALTDLAFLDYQRGQLDEVEGLAREALLAGERADAPRVLASAHNVLGILYSRTGRVREGLEQLQQCLDISRRVGYDGGVATALSNMAQPCFLSGDLERALATFEEALAINLKIENPGAVPTLYSDMGQCYEWQGDWEKALEYYFRAQSFVEQHGLQACLPRVLLDLGSVFLRRGRFDRAIDLLARAEVLSIETGQIVDTPEIHQQLIEACLARGDRRNAQAVLERFRQQLALSRFPERAPYLSYYTARVAMASGALPAARAEIERAIDQNRRLRLWALDGMLQRTLGEIEHALGRIQEADAALQQAIAILSGNGVQHAGLRLNYELALAYLARANFLAAEANDQGAIEQAEKAGAIFSRLGTLLLAEEANRMVLSLQSRSGRVEDTWFAVLRNLSALATWTAPVSELTRACLDLMTGGLHYSAGALYIYGRPPSLVGPLQLATVLALSRSDDLDLQPDTIRLPIRLQGRNVGILYLSGRDPAQPGPDQTFWQVVGHIISTVVEKIWLRIGEPEAADFASAAAPNGANHGSGVISGTTPAAIAIRREIEQLARVRDPVLIDGEHGTGKERIARAIHNLSSDAARPLVMVSCAALPEVLLEAELFGTEPGLVAGRLQEAHQGSLFLDEIGRASLAIQSRLLTVLPDPDRAPAIPDVRVLAATEEDLAVAVAAGRFHPELFQRLSTRRIVVPPLRERKEDIPVLVEYFITHYSEEFMRPIPAVTAEAMNALMDYHWPGNVQELESAIERGVLVARDGLIKLDDLPGAIHPRET